MVTSPACMCRMTMIAHIRIANQSVSWDGAGWWVSRDNTLGVWGMSYSWDEGPRRWWSSG